ncbi:fetuin-B-like [Gouania willdenowi]|nr:fetuin-B-like [Gouania willdenowi]
MGVHLMLLCVGLLLLEGRASPGVPPGCNSPEAVRVAEDALHQVNQDRISGYVWSLNRLYDVARTTEQNKGVLYKLTIDVLATNCHVISKKPWKDCSIRDIGDIPAYGECEVVAYFDTEVILQSYSCAVREVLATAVVRDCPDCPTADSLDDPIVKETARLSLLKFNQDSSLANYFSLENITMASYQWIVVGPAYNVDFTIVETVCSKTTDPSELGLCPPMDCQFAHKGFCQGSHYPTEDEFEFQNPVGTKQLSRQSSVTVKCEIYEPQASKEEEQAHVTAGQGHTEHQDHNHTHLHSHEHTHTHSASNGTKAPGPKGIVENRPAAPRSAPSASSCPGVHRHKGLVRFTT